MPKTRATSTAAGPASKKLRLVESMLFAGEASKEAAGTRMEKKLEGLMAKVGTLEEDVCKLRKYAEATNEKIGCIEARLNRSACIRNR